MQARRQQVWLVAGVWVQARDENLLEKIRICYYIHFLLCSGKNGTASLRWERTNSSTHLIAVRQDLTVRGKDAQNL